MRKEIQIEELLNFEEGRRSFRVVKQTHRDSDFGKGGDNFTASNGIKLASQCGPEWSEYEANTLYVRGEYGSHDRDIITCKLEDFLNIQQAIQEYNIAFGAIPKLNISIGNRRKEVLKKSREEVLF